MKSSGASNARAPSRISKTNVPEFAADRIRSLGFRHDPQPVRLDRSAGGQQQGAAAALAKQYAAIAN